MFKSPDFRNLKNIFKKYSKAILTREQEQENINNTVHQRYRIDVLFVFTLFVLTITLYFCWGIVINPKSSPENVKFAISLIMAIVSGLVGFITGKAIG